MKTMLARSRQTGKFLGAITTLAAALLLLTSCGPSPKGGGVHGSLFLGLPGAATVPSNATIYLPDMKVQLKNVKTNAFSGAVTTNLNGEYFIPHQAPGTYQACWDKPGLISACSPNVTIVSDTAFGGDLPVNANPGILIGRVTLKDGSVCRTVDHFFKIDVFTKVSLVDGANVEVVPAVRANSFGEYVLAGIPGNATNLTVRATCEDAKVEQKIGGKEGITRVDLTLPNSRPTITAAIARFTNKGVRRAPLGASVDAQVQTIDPDGDTLHYRWGVQDGNGTVVSA
ncbi:MAG TPA: hypothetical protein VG488_10405, partial [Candidatus Angelobacter sp.]|nr:hypothetical protein [Candidatus Angelobacter sp.]